MASAHCGTLEACFSSPTLPAMSAGAAKRKTCQNGKFHGITASTGPMRLVGTKLRDGVGLDDLVAQELLGMLGVVAAAPRALGRLLHRGLDRLAHLRDHHPAERLLLALENLGGA